MLRQEREEEKRRYRVCLKLCVFLCIYITICMFGFRSLCSLSISCIIGSFALANQLNFSLIELSFIFQEQKKLQEQLAAEQEALFGSRPTTKKPLGQSTNTNSTVGTPIGRRVMTPSGRIGFSGTKEHRESGRVNNVIPLNYVALQKDDSAR